MAQFDVHRYRGDNPDVVFLLDIQSELLSSLRTRAVVPLVTIDRVPSPLDRLHPVFEIDGQAYVMLTTELAGIESRLLGEVVVSLDAKRDVIIGALDFLLLGY